LAELAIPGGGVIDTLRTDPSWRGGKIMTVEAFDREQRLFAAVPASARAARSFVAASLGAAGATASVISDYELVVSELVANLIEHGDGTGLRISVDVADRQWWDVAVGGTTSAGGDGSAAPSAWRVADPFEPSGRGLGIVRRLMDEVVADSAEGESTIHCRRRRV
jgi:anti-sigma regulatory factor (Ser/Thr protein kinase)